MLNISAGTSTNRSANPQIRKFPTQGFGLRIANRVFTANICGFAVKELKSTANQQHRWDRFFAIFKVIRFYDSMYRQIWVDVFIKYNTPLQSYYAVEQLFSMGAASLTAK